MGATDEQVRRRRRDREQNLERVLRAAEELFAERGTDVRMEEVARRAGVGVGTIYRRFPSKEQLFSAVSLAVCEDTRCSLTRAADDADDAAAKLRAIIAAHYRRCQTQAPLLDGPPHADEGEHPGLYTALHELLAEVIAAGQAQGRLGPGDPATMAALTLELLSPRAVQRISRTVGDPDAAAEQVADFVLAGLGLRAAP
jgi:AcrR family transcriptional regulator